MVTTEDDWDADLEFTKAMEEAERLTREGEERRKKNPFKPEKGKKYACDRFGNSIDADVISLKPGWRFFADIDNEKGEVNLAESYPDFDISLLLRGEVFIGLLEFDEVSVARTVPPTSWFLFCKNSISNAVVIEKIKDLYDEEGYYYSKLWGWTRHGYDLLDDDFN